MPLYKTINFSPTTQILVWEITESLVQLLQEVTLNPTNTIRFNGMKSELHQRAFLSVRKLLQEKNYTDFDLFYDETGKPNLIDGKHISISHSHEFSTIIISNESVGIDIEKQREKSVKIASKFIGGAEHNYLNRSDINLYIEGITILWCAKEAVFKICNEKGISFKNNIFVHPFELHDTKTTATLTMENVSGTFQIFFESFEGFTLVCAFEY